MDITIVPEIPPEVMTIILSNLRRNDLLNCRLVCHSWNKECLRHLRKSKYTLRLDLERITSYVQFTKSNPKFILPFYIDLNMEAYIQICLTDDVGPLHELDKFKKNLKLLINWFGPECVASLKLVSLRVFNNDRYCDKISIFLVELFSLVSTGLKMLEIRNLFIDSEVMEYFISKIKQPNNNFPKLKKLKVDSHAGQYLRSAISIVQPIFQSIWAQPDIVQFVFQNSPWLENLKLLRGYHTVISDISISIPFEKLKSIKLGLVNNPSELLRQIQECQFLPVLEKLSFGLPPCDEENENEMYLYHDILGAFSKTIKTLTIKFYGRTPVLKFKFPKFPRLEYLKIEIVYLRFTMPFFLNPYDINFNPDTFPMLKSIKIPNGCFFMPKDSLEQFSSPSLEIPIFSNITKLIIDVYDWIYNNTSHVKDNNRNNGFKLINTFFQKYVKHLHTVFPNVTSIVIVDKCVDQEIHDVKHVIKELIQSDFASSIQDITLWNFDQDYLGQALKQLSYHPRFILENVQKNSKYEKKIQNIFKNWTGSSDVLSITSNVLDEQNIEKQIITVVEKNKCDDHKMTNIHTIKYEQDRPSSKKKWIRRSKNVLLNELDLTMMVKYFPNLHQVGISSLKFDQDKQKCSEHIQNIRIQFPNIIINII